MFIDHLFIFLYIAFMSESMNSISISCVFFAICYIKNKKYYSHTYPSTLHSDRWLWIFLSMCVTSSVSWLIVTLVLYPPFGSSRMLIIVMLSWYGRFSSSRGITFGNTFGTTSNCINAHTTTPRLNINSNLMLFIKIKLFLCCYLEYWLVV